MPDQNQKVYKISIDKLVHGGQGIATLPDGRKVFVWGVLPDEEVEVEIIKSRKDYAEAKLVKILKKSDHRIKPKDENFLSTSPWQIIDDQYEDELKKQILTETFLASLKSDLQKLNLQFYSDGDFWNYRNKMEFSFFGDESGLHLALYNRGTHKKQIIDSSSIAKPEINKSAKQICDVLNSANVRAGDLKSLVLRCSTDGEVVAALYVKNQDFPKINELNGTVKGLVVVYSNPKSPVSIRSKDLYSFGDISLSEEFFGSKIQYDVFSFFQVNIPIFNLALNEIADMTNHDEVIDLYSGVGAIGLALKNTKILIETDHSNVIWATKNADKRDVKVVEAPSEKALSYIDDSHTLIVDPPRAGLHKDVVARILDVNPPKIIYLSCNPSTQERDVEMLMSEYEITSISGYNFFPKTPHIESLITMSLKNVKI